MTSLGPADDAGGSYACDLTTLQAAVDDVVAMRGFCRLDPSEFPPELRPLARSVDSLHKSLRQLHDFGVPLAKGELGATPPSDANPMAAPLLEMHENLMRLTTQTQAVARGDYSQRIDFLGDFSQAFNSMVELLAAREAELRSEIARRAEAESNLQRERDLLVSGPVITFHWDIDDDCSVLYVSPNISALGYRAEEFTEGHRTYMQIIHPDDRGWALKDGINKSDSGLEAWTQEYRLLDIRGETHWVRDVTRAVRDDRDVVTGYEGYIIDITAEKRTEAALRRREEQLRMLSLVDDLTGLYNRRGLYALGEHAMRGVRRRKTMLGVVSLDVAGLSAINDRLGHEQGDDALASIAAMLKEAIRESDVVARAGDDEFVILIEDDPDVIADVVRRMRRRVDAFAENGDRPYRLEVSIGAVQWTPDKQTKLQELLERAEQRRNDARSAERPA